MLIHVVLCCILAFSVEAVKLPSYLKPCARSRPDFKQCATKNGRDALPFVIKGDPKYNLPNLDPFFIKKLSLSSNSGAFKIATTFTDLQVLGMSKVVLEEYDVDFKNQVVKYTCFHPRNEMVGNYDMQGKMFNLPFSGRGKANITFDNFRVTTLCNYTLKVKPDGKRYSVLGAATAKATTERAHYSFDNLFNGDKLLGTTMNQLMNDNWRVLFDEFGPSMGNAQGEIFKSIAMFLNDRVPFDEIYPPK